MCLRGLRAGVAVALRWAPRRRGGGTRSRGDANDAGDGGGWQHLLARGVGALLPDLSVSCSLLALFGLVSLKYLERQVPRGVGALLPDLSVTTERG